MRFQFFTVPVHGDAEAEEALNRFCGQHRIAAVEKQFVADGRNSFWSFCICYLHRDDNGDVSTKGKIDYREVLDEKDFAVFAKLRSLRKSLAQENGVPAYALFTNEQLAAMVRQKVATTADMGKIEGIGQARLERYGESFLQVLRQELENP